jgi:tetratricopeptide (TPR) repeat protein
MKTYRNDELGFEISIPENWSNPIIKDSYGVIFNCSPIEMFNIIVGPLIPERILEYTAAEFRQYAESKNYSDLIIGKINIGNKEHVWAKYNMGREHWTKKYMVVFGGIEYAITGTCYNKEKSSEKEEIWDNIVRSFRLSEWRRKQAEALKEYRSLRASELFEKAYEASSEGRYLDACNMLEECLEKDPNHILAHKEIAFILKNTGDPNRALSHRIKVKELDPSDRVNLYNLAMLFYILGDKAEAMKEINELLKMNPNNKRYIETRRYFISN